jgi:hypothetical protein
VFSDIPAIYYFFSEYQERMMGEYKGEFDNFLFYFSYNYKLIQEEYRYGDKLFPRKGDYVKLVSGNEGKEEKQEPNKGKKRRGKRESKKEPPPPKKQKKEEITENK